MNSSTRVEHSGALSAEQQSIWNYWGIDLFVDLQIDTRTSTRVDRLSPRVSSDAPRPAQVYPHTLVTPPVDVVEEKTLHNGERRLHREISREDSAARSRIVEEPTCADFASGELKKLDGEVLRGGGRVFAQTEGEQSLRQGKQSARVEARRSLPGVAVRRYMARFNVSPVAVQRDEPRCLHNSVPTSSTGHQQVQERNDQPDEQSSEDDHDKVCDLDSQCRQCKYEFSSSGNVIRGCRCLAVNDNLGEPQSVRQKDLDDQSKGPTTKDEEFDRCNENRSWSPQVEDYSWVPMDIRRDPDNRLTGCSDGNTEVGKELDQHCHKFPSEKDVVERILQLEHHTNRSLDALLPSKFPVIESYDMAEVLAACQLVRISAYNCGKDFSEQELITMEGFNVVNNLEFRGESNEDRLPKVVGTTYGSMLPDIDVSNTKKSLQPGVHKWDRSPWSDEDRYIPRIARRARGRLRGSQFRTRIDFGNTNVDEESDSEVLHRPPRKRQYKSTQQLLLP